MTNSKILLIVLPFLTLILGFFLGMQYQRSTQPVFGNLPQQFRQKGSNINGRMGNFPRMGTNGQFRPVVGQIISMDSGTLTVKMQDGSSRLVLISGNTPVIKSQSGALSDLKIGIMVRVEGSYNTDGSVTAQGIQVNPILGNINNGVTSGNSAPSGY